MHPWQKHLEKGALVCPATKQALAFDPDAQRLVTADGARSYALVDSGVPILLEDPKGFDRDLSSSSMTKTYGRMEAAPSGGSRRNLRERLRHKLDVSMAKDYRAEASIAAFDTPLEGLVEDAIVLSVGGGPMRFRPCFTNLNMAPFANVDIVADAHALPYANNSVDAVFVMAVLEHVYAPSRAVAEMYRVLKPGSMVYASSPFIFPYHGYPHHYQNYTLTGHERLFEDHQFKVLESGVDTGPSYAFVNVVDTYFREYCTGWWFRPFRAAWTAFAHGLITRRDRVLNQRPNAHLLASTTYVLAKKV